MYLSGNETVQAPPGDDEKALLKSLIEQAENSSLGTADTQMLASLLTARLGKSPRSTSGPRPVWRPTGTLGGLRTKQRFGSF